MAVATKSVKFRTPSWVLDDILTLPPEITVSKWCDRYRNLSPRYAAEPGRWRTARLPYLREILDAFADPTVSQITVKKSARCGGTELMYSMLSYAVDAAPGPILYLLDTEHAAKEEVTGRLRHAIEDNPRTRAQIPYVGWATTSALHLRSCELQMCWASSDNTLLRRTARYGFVDELDNVAVQAGRLGDKLAAFRERLTNFGARAKLVIASSPTHSRAATAREYGNSDQRRFQVPCPACGVYRVLKLEHIKYPEGATANDIEEDGLAWLECPNCKAELDDTHREWSIDRGAWVPACQSVAEPLDVEDDDIVERAITCGDDPWLPELIGEEPRGRHRGYHISRLMTPGVWSRCGNMVHAFAAENVRTQQTPPLRRVFINAWLGEDWEDVEATLAVRQIKKRAKRNNQPGMVPEGVLGMVSGWDVQESSVYVVVRAWGFMCESWLIAHRHFEANEALGEDRYDAMEKAYEFTYHSNFREMDGHGKIRIPVLTVIDSGYKAKNMRGVYEFCRRHGRRTLPGKGWQGREKFVQDWGTLCRRMKVQPKNEDEKSKWRPLLCHINTSACKELLYDWAKKDTDGPYGFHLHSLTDEDTKYLEQFTAEHRVLDEKGQLVWKPKTEGRANHYLDAEVNGLAAAETAELLWRRNTSPEQPKLQTRTDVNLLTRSERREAIEQIRNRGGVRTPMRKFRTTRKRFTKR